MLSGFLKLNDFRRDLHLVASNLAERVYNLLAMQNYQEANLVGVVSARGSHPKYHSEVEIFKLRAPVVVGQKIGVLRVFDGDDEVARTSLVAAATVKRAGFWETVRDIVTFGTAK